MENTVSVTTTRPAWRTGDQVGGVLDIAVAVYRHFGLGQAGTVDDGGVIELVRDDPSARSERGEHPQVGLEAGRKDQGRLAVPPRRDVVFEGGMDRPVTDDQPR